MFPLNFLLEHFKLIVYSDVAVEFFAESFRVEPLVYSSVGIEHPGAVHMED